MTNQKQDARGSGGEGRRGGRRARIVGAARELLAWEGYDGVTMKQVAREAGVAQGLIHYYFPGKGVILLEVLMEASGEYARGAERLVASLPESGNLLEAALADTRDRVHRAPEWYRLCYELFAMGLRDPGFLPGVAALLESGRSGIAATLGRALGGETAEGSAGQDPEKSAAAAVLLACFDGLALQKLADPDGLDVDSAYDVLAKMAQWVIEVP